ncbi:MAG TPA: DUF177 domain-containing protein [Bacteroidales bacterium]|nr:DUF177 domain-containing protein [Bacteroidales bacterium]
MSGLYALPLSGLKEGLHTFDFEIGKEFFEEFEESEINEGSLQAIVIMEKRSTHLDLQIKISGAVMISCDRCLEMFSRPVKCENRLLVKLGKIIPEDDPDIVSLSSDEHELDLMQHLYEYIHLALPIKRVHPDDKDGKSTCNPFMLKKLKELFVVKENEKHNDPRWDDLKKLMNN